MEWLLIWVLWWGGTHPVTASSGIEGGFTSYAQCQKASEAMRLINPPGFTLDTACHPRDLVGSVPERGK